jgi:hypothetical protein
VKVEQKKAFEPIQITLETEAEAEALWHRLNCPVATPFRDYCEKHRVKEPWLFGMWNALDNVFTPKERGEK